MNKISKIIIVGLILFNLANGAVATHNINHLYDRIENLEKVNSQLHHRILKLENGQAGGN